MDGWMDGEFCLGLCIGSHVPLGQDALSSSSTPEAVEPLTKKDLGLSSP